MNLLYIPLQSVDCPVVLTIDRDISDKQNNAKVEYILYAAVVHNGSEVQFGHYYTFARHSDDALQCYKNYINNKYNKKYLGGGNWYRFDDERVTKSSYNALNSLSYHDTPYMLFYVRIEK